MNSTELRDLVKVEELEEKAAPGAMMPGQSPVIKPLTIVWDM